MSQNIPPTCSKCGLQHWRFALCSDGKTYKQMGYDSIVKPSGYGRDTYGGRFKQETEYSRLQKRSKPRAAYREEE